MGVNMEKMIVLGSTEVANLVGIQATLLNKFVERKQYKIEASVRPAGGRGKERLFGVQDVYGIALVHWLFESGLRSQVIQRVLDDVCKVEIAKANDAAAILLHQEGEFLVVTRQVRLPGEKHLPKQKTKRCSVREATARLIANDPSVVVVIPFQRLFSKLEIDLGID